MTAYSAELIVDSSKIVSNISQLKSLMSDEAKFMFIVKSNAYGHGLKEIVQKIESNVDAFGVVRIEEAILVRSVTSKPILLMQGIYTDSEIHIARENNSNQAFKFITSLESEETDLKQLTENYKKQHEQSLNQILQIKKELKESKLEQKRLKTDPEMALKRSI